MNGVLPYPRQNQSDVTGNKMNYQDYLASDDWQEKRKTKRDRRKRCGVCGATENLDVHHLNYKNLVDVRQDDLRVMCRRCHFIAHELHRSGKFKFRNGNHHSRWGILHDAVRKELIARGDLPDPKKNPDQGSLFQ